MCDIVQSFSNTWYGQMSRIICNIGDTSKQKQKHCQIDEPAPIWPFLPYK